MRPPSPDTPPPADMCWLLLDGYYDGFPAPPDASANAAKGAAPPDAAAASHKRRAPAVRHQP